MEEFKNIKGFENYEVSNLGRIRNNKTGKTLKPQIGTHGYYQISLYKDRILFNKKMHKLVGETFIPNPLNKKCLDHIDI